MYCAYDIESTGLNVYKGAEMFSYSIGHEDGSCVVHRLDGKDRIENRKILQKFFDDTTIKKVCHNVKFDRKFTIHYGIHVPNETEWHCTLLMSQLLRNLAPSHSLDYLCWELAGYKRIDKEISTMAKAMGGYQNVPIHIMNNYQKHDAIRGMLLFLFFFPKIKKNPKVYSDYLNEIQLIKVADSMEEYGINTCKSAIDNLIKWMKEEIEQVTFKTIEMFGEPYNFNSPSEVSYLLFQKLELPDLGLTKTGKFKSGKDIILELRERYPEHIQTLDLILKIRSYTKGIAILKGYLESTDTNGVIHANIKTNEAVTGRLACSEPNLMNVSKEGVLKNLFPVPARKAFKCKPRHVLYFVDYSGIELRLGIEVAKSIRMMNLLKEGKSPHIEACKLFYGDRFRNKGLDKDLYGAAKNAHFALMYGAGVSKISRTLMLSPKEGKLAYDNYSLEYPEISTLFKSIMNRINEDGFIETSFGRRLYVPKDKAYSGLNYLIQGTAAGILKRAIVGVNSYLKAEIGEGAGLVMCIHDEIIISLHRSLLNQANHILKMINQIMVTIPEIKVPLEVEWRRSTSTWNKAKNYDINYR